MQPPLAVPTNTKHAMSFGKSALGDDSPPEEDFAGPAPGASLSPASEDPGTIEDMVNSGVLTNGPASAHETGEEELLDALSSSEEDIYGATDATADSDLTSQFTNQMESPASQDDEMEMDSGNRMTGEEEPSGGHEKGVEAESTGQTESTVEAAFVPGSGTQENPLEQFGAKEIASGEPQQSEVEQPEPSLPEQIGAKEIADGEPQQSKVEEPESSPPVNENLLIIRFVEECCERGDAHAATARELYIAYLRWCDENDQQPMSQRDFGSESAGANRSQRDCRRRTAAEQGRGTGVESAGQREPLDHPVCGRML